MIGTHRTLNPTERKWLDQHRNVVGHSIAYITAASCPTCPGQAWAGRSALIVAVAHVLATGHAVNVTRSQVLPSPPRDPQASQEQQPMIPDLPTRFHLGPALEAAAARGITITRHLGEAEYEVHPPPDLPPRPPRQRRRTHHTNQPHTPAPTTEGATPR